MKKVLVFLGLMMLLISCTGQENISKNTASGSDSASAIVTKERIFVSSYPLYFLTKGLVGETYEVINLVPDGGDGHEYEPTLKQIEQMLGSKMVIMNGLGLEHYEEKLTQELSKNNVPYIQLSEEYDTIIEVGVSEEKTHTDEHHEDEHSEVEDSEIQNRMHSHIFCDFDEHNKIGIDCLSHDKIYHEHSILEKIPTGNGKDSHNHGGLDPHTWLSPKVMSELANILAEKLAVQDTPQAQAFIKSLQELDEVFSTRLKTCSSKELVTSHEAFGYLARDYGLTQVPIAGIEPSTEPSASDIADIITLIREKGIKTIFTESLVSMRFTDTIKAETGVQTLELHAIETLSPEESKAGENYITLMTQNLTHITEGLDCK